MMSGRAGFVLARLGVESCEMLAENGPVLVDGRENTVLLLSRELLYCSIQ